MNDEQLSALIDDHLPAGETREAVTQLLSDTRARGTWGRYHLIGDALRASAADSSSTSAHPATDNIIAFPSPPRSEPAVARRVPRGGLAMAAAAALAAVALIVSAPRPAGDAQPDALALKAGAATPMVAVKSPAQAPLGNGLVVGTNDATLPEAGISQTDMVRDDEAERRMNVYLYDFNDKRARQSAPGMHSYVHIVGFERP